MSAKRRKARQRISDCLRTKKMIKKYGNWIAIHGDWTGEIIPNIGGTEYDAFGSNSGWADLWHMCIKELNPIIHRLGLEDRLYFVQIKEKFGEIRAYTNMCVDEVEDIIDKYAAISSHVCQWCGRPDSPISTGYWIECRCKVCDNKIQKKYGAYKAPYNERFNIDPVHCSIPNTYGYTRYENGKKEEVTVDISDTVKEYRERWERKVHRKQRRALKNGSR